MLLLRAAVGDADCDNVCRDDDPCNPEKCGQPPLVAGEQKLVVSMLAEGGPGAGGQQRAAARLATSQATLTMRLAIVVAVFGAEGARIAAQWPFGGRTAASGCWRMERHARRA